MILRTFTSILIKMGIFVVYFFNNIARNVKRLLLNDFKPQEKLRTSYIERSFSKITALTLRDDWVNIHNDYKRIGKDLRKVIDAYEG